MAASLLTSDTLRLVNVPRLADIATMARLLAQPGVTPGGDPETGDEVPDAVPGADGVLEMRAETITHFVAPHDPVRKMRRPDKRQEGKGCVSSSCPRGAP